MKSIDPIDIKKAIKDGQLEVFTNWRGSILIRDTTTGETVKIGEVQNERPD